MRCIMGYYSIIVWGHLLVTFSLSTPHWTTAYWSLTTQIKQWERNVVFGWAGVCGEGWKTSSPKNTCVGGESLWCMCRPLRGSCVPSHAKVMGCNPKNTRDRMSTQNVLALSISDFKKTLICAWVVWIMRGNDQNTIIVFWLSNGKSSWTTHFSA